MEKVQIVKIKRFPPKTIKNIDYGINIWNPNFGLMKNKTTNKEQPSEITVNSDISTSFWKKIVVRSRYFFNPTEVNLAKLIYGSICENIQKNHSNSTREQQNNNMFTLNINELINRHFSNLNKKEIFNKTRQMKKTIKKLMAFQMDLTGYTQNGRTYETTTNFLVDPLLVHDEKGFLQLSYKLSEWFDFERKLDGDKRPITENYPVYQQIETNFGVRIDHFNDYQKTILTIFKSKFDYKKGLKTININLKNDLPELLLNWEGLADRTKRQYFSNYKKALNILSKDENFGQYIEIISTRGDYEIRRF